MSARTLPLMGKTHPLTGEPIRAIGFRPNGDPLWPIMGGDPTNDPPERPEDIPEAEWTALGDPGKQALVRVRKERDDALSAKAQADQALQAARARPAPPKAPAATPPAGTQDDPPKGDAPDMAALVQKAVEDAIKPFQERESERDAMKAASVIADAVTAAATMLHDPTDALANVDLTTVTDGNGKPDAAKIATALDGLAKSKPHLVKDTRRFAPPGAGASPGSVPTIDDRVKDTLARMQQKAGVKFASRD